MTTYATYSLPFSYALSPRWSVIIPVYQAGDYLFRTINSVLCQDPGIEHMQIKLIDDCSDNSYAYKLLEEKQLLGRIEYYRHPIRQGIAKNWNSCIDLSCGQFIHILHQDDLVYPGFYQQLEHGFCAGNAGAVFCRHHYIDSNENILYSSELEQESDGILEDALNKIASSQRIQTPSIAVRRDVYMNLGGFNPVYKYVLDWEMWIRISQNYPVYYVPDVLAAYRIHDASETARLRNTAETIRDMRRLFSMYRSYLDPSTRKSIEINARKNYSALAFREASRLAANGQAIQSLAFIKEGLLCFLRLSSFIRAYYLLRKLLKNIVLGKRKDRKA